MSNSVRQLSLYFAWVIALLALVFSLFSSEVFHLPVCHLCWFQRICIFPLAIILGIASFSNDYNVVKFALPLSILGFLFGLYQYLEQMIPGFAPIKLCQAGGPDCSIIHFELFGFITYPFLSMLATAAITGLLLIAKTHKKN